MQNRRRSAVCLILGIMLPALVAFVTADDVAETTATIDPPTATNQYQTTQLHGWTLKINPAIEAADPDLLAATLNELATQLNAIAEVIPPLALARIRQIEIWIELEMPKTACMCYHVSRDWLIPNGYNADKEGAVEIGNARTFLEWTKNQPWMVLHELAHGYHDQVFGYDEPTITDAWRRIKHSGVYDSVGHISGKPRKHYALTNQMEWFSETTEAFYGMNDFYPHTRSELHKADPDGAALVQRLWEKSPLPEPKRDTLEESDQK